MYLTVVQDSKHTQGAASMCKIRQIAQCLQTVLTQTADQAAHMIIPFWIKSIIFYR